MLLKGLTATTIARGHVFPRVHTCDCKADGCEWFLDQIAEHVIDGGLEIVVICRYGDRRYPVAAFIIMRSYNGHDDATTEIPIPAFDRKDINIPYYGNIPVDFGIT